MMKKYVAALDQGTSSSRAVLFDTKGNIVGIQQKEFRQKFPKPGWVEHDPQEILDSQLTVFKDLIKINEVDYDEISAIGITNQRETTIVWDRNTGVPVYNAIVWQDKRTADICESLKEEGYESYVKRNTGLVIDSYFSATKVKWILDNVEGARDSAKQGNLIFGTVDSWLIWNLTNGKVHATDYSNASRTMLYNIRDLCWDEKMLEALGIPVNMLPEVYPSSYDFGEYQINGSKIPIVGVLGDQQAALFGQACYEPGSVKNTYGTGCFMLMNTGKELYNSDNGLLSTIAWGIDNEVYYALEGSIFIAGAAIQWLRDGIEIIDDASESEKYASKVTDDHGIYVVPAFAGLGAPYWDMYARGAIFGLTLDTGKAQLIRATLESLAYQTKDVLDAMVKDSGLQLSSLKVDGGAATNNFLMQFQADILGSEVVRPKITESTAMGSAYMAGLYTGFWNKEDIANNWQIDETFRPTFEKQKINRLYNGWQRAVKRSMNWIDH